MKRSIIGVLVALLSLTACHSMKSQKNIIHNEKANKAKIETLMNAINTRDVEAAKKVLAPDYEQHNPFIPDRREGLLNLFPVIEQGGVTVETVRLIADGDYVVAHNKWHNAEPFGHGCKEMVAFDFFRINEDGSIGGHWDAMQCEEPPNASGRTLTDGATEIEDLDKTMDNKAKFKALFFFLTNGGQEKAGKAFANTFHPNYKQHNLFAADGMKGFMAAMPKEQWVFQKQHKVIGEGNFVLSIAEGTHRGKRTVFYDLVRFENGKIAEHWDVIQEIPTENLANDNTMFNF